MTKYIHYKKPLNSMGVLISDNVDESKKGYTLGMEIECDCFDSVLSYMMVNHRDHITIECDIATNENLTGFRNEFVRCMDVIGKFASEKYKIRVIHENDTVTWYTKEVLPKIQCFGFGITKVTVEIGYDRCIVVSVPERMSSLISS